MLKLKRNLLSVALASATMLVAASVQAQTVTDGAQENPSDTTQDEASTLDKVTVTGIRVGIERAIETKQSADVIVEAISAEDIGKLPDQSIAESIARLPGLTAQRVAGRASTISIRGLAEDFGTTLLNGREQVSVGHNRGAEFDQYPSELLSAVVVHKTVDAGLIGQGLSGTVNLKTVRPLDFAERVAAFNVRGEKNSLGELNPGYDDMGFRASASYIDQFLDDKLGVAIGYAHMDSPGQANRWEAWGYPTDFPGAGGNAVIGGSKSIASSTESERDGLMGVLEFKPSDRYSTVLDLFYSEFDKSETSRFIEAPLGWGNRNEITLTNPVIRDGMVVGGTFNNVRPVLRNDLNTQDDKIFAAGWNHKFRFNDQWTATADLSWSKAEREEMLLETYAGLGHVTQGNTANVDFTIDTATGLPHFTYDVDLADPANVVLTDPAGWGQAGFVKFPSVEDELTSLRVGAERSFDDGIFSSVEFGANRAEREKTRRSGLEAFLRVPNGGLSMPIPGSAINDPADLGFTGIPGSISYDIMQVYGLYEIDPHSHPDIRNKNWTVNEDTTTGYVKWNINTDVGSTSLRGNVGLQVVRVDQSSDGLIVPFSDADAPVPLTGGAVHTDVLPSLNLAFGLAHDQTLRIGLGEQMARPRMDQMRANQNVEVKTDRGPIPVWYASGGNPELEPWRATALDVSYEKYFADRGYVSLAAFHKDLHSWVMEVEEFGYDFTGYEPRGLMPPSNIGYFKAPRNVNGGIIYGFEAAVSMPFDLLWAPLDGFGVQASYSNTHSRVTPFENEPAIQLPGLSREVSNITLYYEKYGFSARVSQRKRSSFLGEVQGFGGDRSPRYIQGEEIIDAQLGYTFGEGTSLAGLSLLLQVNNLDNEPYRETFDADGNQPRMYNEYGRQVLLGASYRF
ncbi:hypothetical protein N800_07440 [Lysobacter daejeonensis GH1-9]|uniref:Uncharacterized protein n=1 Tax=Lysobacter daejeonensis GH1-9 TaxID=1385517 RepID=A0A0A0EWI9_9GAMM|nr:TonB-dependent receptor [Lysobacter daejeonensis]KGM53522.1 hypothetical protein N800_07440 [Lysobacter daejeonensis GH1-9]